MNKMKIVPLEPFIDLPKINDWENTFADDPRFSSIKHYILEDNIYYGLDEVICTNYEQYTIGDNERKYCFAVRNNVDEPIAFVLSCMTDLDTQNPELIIQYIVLRPDHQNKGYGYKILTELINNAEEYYGVAPSKLFSRIEETNVASQKLFSKFGCRFCRYTGTNYLKAYANLPNLKIQKED